MAVVGNEHETSFDRLMDIRSRIILASRMLLDHPRDREADLRLQWERVIGRGITGDDTLADEVDSVVAEIERVCRPCLVRKG
jgi:hypothetical protein